jgi:NAD(P)-dependent dehydrogenase (short-subunit alcohol dehydrogenase family)
VSARFTDKVAIVTGAASGIGLATASRLGADGARVLIVDTDEAKAAAAAEQVRRAGSPDARGVRCDVSNEDDVVAAVERAKSELGRVDVIVNNAGIMRFKPLEALTGSDWKDVLEVDLLGAFYFVRQGFRARRRGSAIVNVSSIHAIETTVGVAPYAAAKAALLSLTRSAALEGKPKGIRVNAVLPGAIDTPMLWQNPNVKAGLEKIERSDVGSPEDVARAIAFLASDDAGFITGAAVRVDGGRLSQL